jgi:hypothetical protein
MKKFYFTFGSGQRHFGKFFIIKAETMGVARIKMNDMFGNRWCGCYTSKANAGVTMFGLTEAWYSVDHERASGELEDLYSECECMTDWEVDYLENCKRSVVLTGPMIRKIDEIYLERM